MFQGDFILKILQYIRYVYFLFRIRDQESMCLTWVLVGVNFEEGSGYGGVSFMVQRFL